MDGAESTQTALDQLTQRIDRDIMGALTVGLIYLGDRLGLFDALRAGGPATAAELAARTGLVERYVREWLTGMATQKYLAYEPAGNRFGLTPGQAAIFADPQSRSYRAPVAIPVLKNLEQADRLATAFREGGGVPFAAYGELFIEAMDRINGPQFRAHLLRWLAGLPGAVESLTGGGSYLDVGCGGGIPCVEVARAFPRATALGLDLHAPSIERARAAARAAGLADRVSFETRAIEELPAGKHFDVVTTFDVVHDLADPVSVLRGIRRALAPGGVYLMVESKVDDSLEEQIASQVNYGWSVFHCLPQSLAEGGAGLGNPLRPAMARELATAAGFSSFTVLPIDDEGRAFYDMRA